MVQMTTEELIAREEIRDLVRLYSRAVDRKDVALLRDLYTANATDSHGDTFDGPATDYCDFIEKSLPYMRYSGHHVCNHMVSVDGDRGEGEVYAMAWHVIPDSKGGWTEDFMCVRYLDHYAREGDGRWRFAKRVVTYDMRTQRPFVGKVDDRESEPSTAMFTSRIFARGARA
jgi:ketosteroid isomerase-like protein